jgi:hypothetical protein
MNCCQLSKVREILASNEHRWASQVIDITASNINGLDKLLLGNNHGPKVDVAVEITKRPVVCFFNDHGFIL